MLVAGHNSQKTMLGADKLKHRNTKKSFTTLKLIAQIGAMNRNKKKNGENNIIPVEEDWDDHSSNIRRREPHPYT